jgi:16S rRNA (guanine527-N7)-methyltransferase
MNLTTVTDEGEFVARHLLDSIAALPAFPAFPAYAGGGHGAGELRAAQRVVDVGTGAGFPGVPLAIACPDKDFLLIDSLRKRVGFLEEACAELGLDNVQTLHARAEDAARNDTTISHSGLRPGISTAPLRESFDLAKNHESSTSRHSGLRPGISNEPLRESFDLAVCRAVGRLAVLCEYCLPLVRVGGKVCAYKSESQASEIGESAKALATLGAAAEVEIISADERVRAATPDSAQGSNDSQGPRHIIMVIKKERPTPSTYPRRSGVPTKSPL